MEGRSKRERVVSRKIAEAEQHAQAIKDAIKDPPKRPAKKAKTVPEKKKPAPKAAKIKPHIMVVLVHVDRNGNSTDFYLAPDSKVSPENLEKLAACHHGALNDDQKQFEEIKVITHYLSAHNNYYPEQS